MKLITEQSDWKVVVLEFNNRVDEERAFNLIMGQKPCFAQRCTGPKGERRIRIVNIDEGNDAAPVKNKPTTPAQLLQMMEGWMEK